jgi:hypothetical protein
MPKPRVYVETTIPSFYHFGHIRRVNALLGLFVPALVTPLELLGGSDETESE